VIMMNKLLYNLVSRTDTPYTKGIVIKPRFLFDIYCKVKYHINMHKYCRLSWCDKCKRPVYRNRHNVKLCKHASNK
jgi:hypothetical protein